MGFDDKGPCTDEDNAVGVASSKGHAPKPPSGVLITGTILSVEKTGKIEIEMVCHGGSYRVECRSLVAVSADDIGSSAAFMLEDGSRDAGIIIGLIWQPDDESIFAHPQTDLPDSLNFRADKDITLSCGKASVTLTRAGKIILRGAYLSSRSTGVNRIKGGSVQIN